MLVFGLGIRFVGAGVSGGEEGARFGPSLMPGGNKEAWPHIKAIFQAVAAKADGQPCCDWVGSDGAGHFVKMVHNGIEYGDMQLIGEVYHIMLALGISQEEMANTFAEWNKGELDSFLIDITKDILKYKDEDGKLNSYNIMCQSVTLATNSTTRLVIGQTVLNVTQSVTCWFLKIHCPNKAKSMVFEVYLVVLISKDKTLKLQ